MAARVCLLRECSNGIHACLCLVVPCGYVVIHDASITFLLIMIGVVEPAIMLVRSFGSSTRVSLNIGALSLFSSACIGLGKYSYLFVCCSHKGFLDSVHFVFITFSKLLNRGVQFSLENINGKV